MQQCILDRNYNINLTGRIFESLIIQNCIDDKVEVINKSTSINSGLEEIHVLCKRYKCICYICGNIHTILSKDFYVDYKSNRTPRYSANTFCTCHELSSFQWEVIHIFMKHGIPYNVEVTMDGLVGFDGVTPLKFDFGVWDNLNNFKCCIECQGRQHFKPDIKYGGQEKFNRQIEYDKRKREYCKIHGIRLIEIPYTYDTCIEVEEFLYKAGVLSNIPILDVEQRKELIDKSARHYAYNKYDELLEKYNK